ncbi:MAG: hypothetical protein E5V37_04830 [Mesorhizobium sp.]|uniref:hypothetical protein n=1 Tax=unclassified Mesorhizobium TaxID=325217 RepID=UPI000FCA0192|nr:MULTISPECIES: hypothetical protein [unclassified Mesorhizobium]RUW40423.1 hypothetical protein EOA37_15085 [Mesorhizobium sp. M2A.F.Ca.ET.015.02.1.1]RVC97934.1 hypothetical protein EN739_02470 [Mesorhizobium sp. M2A.F.Ca.ET.017.03.2.1]RVD08666.1 hypothetical protein EN753_13285 [Mesorhizobium sp. M2A.F.Ca.ET.029.05.1.1]RWB40625.1 MAG: hypothetical protein EOQ46_24245 [Mesorhizobium sp.]RWB62692.1 MAG: hypothetical protein EOQ48_11230 [Mesorhizobium sp.]
MTIVEHRYITFNIAAQRGVANMFNVHPGQVVQYGHNAVKAFVLAPAHFRGFWQVENVYDDDGEFAIVAEEDLRPAELDDDERGLWGLVASRPN